MIPQVRMSFFFRQAAVPACCACLLAAAEISRGQERETASSPLEPLSCVHASDGRVTVRGAAMGTVFTVRAYPGHGMDAAETEKACMEALACAVRWEKVMSAMDAESGLARLNAAGNGVSVPVSPELERALLLALDYARLTKGSFDPTLGPCIRLWKKSRRRGALPSSGELECALRASGWEKLRVGKGTAVKTVPGMRVDLGGIGKGFAVDRMAEILREGGISSFFIDSTSDVLAGAPPPGERGWRLLVDEGNGKNTVLLLSHAAVSTSGNARQMVKIGGTAYSHVLDPRTGLGVTEGRQVSVQAPSAALADALATAGSVMREEDFRFLAAGLPGVSVPAFFRSSSRSAEGTQEQDGAQRPR